MPNIKFQDLNAVIHNTSRYGLDYDVAHVTMLMQTDELIQSDLIWAIPHIEDINPKALNLLKDGKAPLYPTLKSKLRTDVSDILQNVDSDNKEGVYDDIEKLLLLMCMHETTIDPIDTSNCLYLVSYKYRLYPVEPNNFEFKVLLPFDGLNIANGGRLQVTCVTPTNAIINSSITRAEDVTNGQTVSEESVQPLSNVSKNVVTFFIQQDPIFTIRYNY